MVCHLLSRTAVNMRRETYQKHGQHVRVFEAQTSATNLANQILSFSASYRMNSLNSFAGLYNNKTLFISSSSPSPSGCCDWLKLVHPRHSQPAPHCLSPLRQLHLLVLNNSIAWCHQRQHHLRYTMNVRYQPDTPLLPSKKNLQLC